MKKSELKQLIKEVIQEETTNLDQVVKKYFSGDRSFNKLSSIINNFQDEFTISDKEIEEYLLSQPK